MRYLKRFENFKIYNQFNEFIDYTSLTGKETEKDIIDLCEKAIQLGVKSVCVYPKWVRKCKELLSKSNVLVCTVISFPHGDGTTDEKISETGQAIRDGADEIDMVFDWIKFKELSIIEELKNDVLKVFEVCQRSNTILKVIVESGELTDEETRLVTNLCIDVGVDYIKTSTGKVNIGAELNKVKIMFETILERKSNMKIKASGGIRTLDDVEKFAPYVDRFGMGYGSVDEMNGIGFSDSNY
jgi:deoxyribose-phosphate aldolase